ncbi:YbaK/EbsC family protein [Streptomyces sp. SID3343]|uniref:YbaK/EbsC family protein n=1 Tax=Streptomyces sp. SID3343 TaxID=2690260 RepID=UPI00136BCC54|nr:YbaK/EbsC family protein [Streptomyces sp. SID3343]MYW00590.1 YbaK/EbsC family protein [Streptomyces sp. SID3343]
MNTPVQNVADALRALNATGEIREFTETVPTAAAAAEQLGCEVGAIANSLIFSADGRPLLVVTSGAHRVDTLAVAKLLGIRKVRRADPAFVLAATGQEVGGVAPIGHPHRVRTLVDTWLSKHEVVWAGAGDHNHMYPTTYEELLRMTGGQAADVGP